MADKISEVKETSSYDNYVGKKETIKSHGLPIEEDILNMNVKKNHKSVKLIMIKLVYLSTCYSL